MSRRMEGRNHLPPIFGLGRRVEWRQGIFYIVIKLWVGDHIKNAAAASDHSSKGVDRGGGGGPLAFIRSHLSCRILHCCYCAAAARTQRRKSACVQPRIQGLFLIHTGKNPTKGAFSYLLRSEWAAERSRDLPSALTYEGPFWVMKNPFSCTIPRGIGWGLSLGPGKGSCLAKREKGIDILALTRMGQSRGRRV